MNLSSAIEVTLPCGKVINLENTLTYEGVSKLTKVLSGRDSRVDFSHLYLRHATVRSDADDSSLSFSAQRDIRESTVEDFKNDVGSAGHAILDLYSGSQLLSTDSNLYECNIIRFPVSFQAAGLGIKFKNTNLANYSIVYYMGIAERPVSSQIPSFDQTKYDNGDYDKILSVIRITDDDLFGVPATGTVDIKYDLNLSI